MSEEEKKICPFCNSEININAKKCRFCNSWLDEEIECPFCAEKIKKSAKKCRFCGEILPQKSNKKINFNFLSNKFLFIIIPVILILCGLIYQFFLYIPNCDNKNIKENLINKIKLEHSTINNLIFNEEASILKKNKKGYECVISAIADEIPVKIEYSFEKASINNYNIDFSFVLPDCFDNGIKFLLSELIKESSYLDINKVISDVEIDNPTIIKHDEKLPSYQCNAIIKLSSKPGKAFVLNSWDYENAKRKISCTTEYKTLFCENGYTACVNLKDILHCKYTED
ncbi:hypothetical protein J6Q66_04850 [bacterium]|nr:hypothetical protein [bacterium]